MNPPESFTDPQIETMINDRMDGLLSADEEQALDEVLRSRPEWRAVAGSLVRLRTEARALPRDHMPRRDLWPELRDRLTPRGEGAAAPSRWARWWLPVSGAAAVSLVLVLLAGPLLRSPGSLPASVPVTQSWAVWADGFERECGGAGRELMATLAGRSDDGAGLLDPFSEPLRVLDVAIVETRGALQADPNNSELARMLAHRYEQKLELLHRANRLAGRV